MFTGKTSPNLFNVRVASPSEMVWKWEREHPVDASWPLERKKEVWAEKRIAQQQFRDQYKAKINELLALGCNLKKDFKTRTEAEKHMAKFPGHGLYVMEFSYLF